MLPIVAENKRFKSMNLIVYELSGSDDLSGRDRWLQSFQIGSTWSDDHARAHVRVTLCSP